MYRRSPAEDHVMKLMQDNRGFSLIELLVSTAVMLVVLALASRSLFEAMRAEEAIGLLADANQSLQSAQTMVVRDLVDAGRNVTIGGLSMPTGGNAIVRPGPTNVAASGWPTAGTLYAVTPGNELGPVVNGNTTDAVTIVSVDDNMQPNTSRITVTVGTGATVTMPAGQGVATNSRNTPRVGDLMWVTRAGNSAVLYVTGVEANPLTFTAIPAGDPSNFNQQGATTGSMVQVGSTPPQPPAPAANNSDTMVRRLKMTTYWVEELNGVPYLMRQENYRAPVEVGLGIDNLELMYDVIDGAAVVRVDNPFVDRAGTTPNQFDKAFVVLAVRSDKKFAQTKNYLRNDLTTQVSFRSLQVRENFR
jgi:prepilin-type N-terminal cleavage/methylation domain-containing protein